MFFAHILEYVLLFLDDNENEESKWFSSGTSSASGYCLAFCLLFCQFQHGVACKNNVYKKTCSYAKSPNDNQQKNMEFVLFELIYGTLFWLKLLFIFAIEKFTLK